MHHPVEKLGYTIEETRRAIGIGRTKIYEEINAEHLETIKIGRRTIITNLTDYIAKKRREAGHATAS